MTPLEIEATKAWQEAYQRTDLVARLTCAALLDYRNNGDDLRLPAPIQAQLDRVELGMAVEQAAHDRLEQIRGAA